MSIAVENQKLWEHADVVAEYVVGPTDLWAVEEEILRKYQDDYSGKHVLDLGIGCGRTTPWLARHAASYVGLDYSHEMVRIARSLHPQWDLRWGDAGDLSEFMTNSLDFILFSGNGIDCVDHKKRIGILHEIKRVLKYEGVLTFNSHNLSYKKGRSKIKSVFCFGFFSNKTLTHPVRMVKYLRRVGVRLRNSVMNARKEVHGDQYALLNDPTHDFSLVGYFVHAEAQVQQLREVGFRGPVEVYDKDGRLVQTGMDTSDSYFLQYVTRKL